MFGHIERTMGKTKNGRRGSAAATQNTNLKPEIGPVSPNRPVAAGQEGWEDLAQLSPPPPTPSLDTPATPPQSSQHRSSPDQVPEDDPSSTPDASHTPSPPGSPERAVSVESSGVVQSTSTESVESETREEVWFSSLKARLNEQSSSVPSGGAFLFKELSHRAPSSPRLNSSMAELNEKQNNMVSALDTVGASAVAAQKHVAAALSAVQAELEAGLKEALSGVDEARSDLRAARAQLKAQAGALAAAEAALEQSQVDFVDRMTGEWKVFSAEKAAWSKARATAMAAGAVQGTMMKLNVGGVEYSASVRTLRSVTGAWFDRALSGAVKVRVDGDGVYHVDRNGEMFAHVLDWLRSPEEWIAPEDADTLRRLRLEAEAYDLRELVTTIEQAQEKVQGLQAALASAKRIAWLGLVGGFAMGVAAGIFAPSVVGSVSKPEWVDKVGKLIGLDGESDVGNDVSATPDTPAASIE